MNASMKFNGRQSTVKFVNLLALIVLGLSFCLSSWAANSENIPQPVCIAIERLAKGLAIDVADIQVISIENVQWPDRSLGVAKSGRMYGQVVTPGYRIILEAEGKQYFYHTDLEKHVQRVQASTVVAAQTTAIATPESDIVTACKNDLARRLNVDAGEIKLLVNTPETFGDSSLNLPEPGMVYLQVITAGSHIEFECKGREYFYNATGRFFRYGGPLESYKHSVLYLERIPNEANLNSNLMTMSFVGTNPRLLIEAVSEFWPQADGSILAARRTSRSGFDLIYLAPGERDGGKVIRSAFYFNNAQLSSDGKTLAVVQRTGLGSGWELAISPLMSKDRDDAKILELPDRQPVTVAWQGDVLLLGFKNDEMFRWMKAVEDHGTLSLQPANDVEFPEMLPLMLNKSQTLDVVCNKWELDDEISTRVVNVWFTGDEDVVAKIPGMTLKSAELCAASPYILITGTIADEKKYVIADATTGELIYLKLGESAQPRLWSNVPTDAWLEFEVSK